MNGRALNVSHELEAELRRRKLLDAAFSDLRWRRALVNVRVVCDTAQHHAEVIGHWMGEAIADQLGQREEPRVALDTLLEAMAEGGAALTRAGRILSEQARDLRACLFEADLARRWEGELEEVERVV